MSDETQEENETELDEDLSIDEESADKVSGGVRATVTEHRELRELREL